MKSALLTAAMLILSPWLVYAQDAGQQTPPREISATTHSIVLPNISVKLKEGEGRGKTESFCAICHSLDYIIMQPKFSKTQWTGTVTKMIKTFGAPIPQDDAEKIIQYLATEYGTGK